MKSLCGEHSVELPCGICHFGSKGLMQRLYGNLQMELLLKKQPQ